MLSSLISFPSPIALLAGSLLAALVWGFWRTDMLTIAPGCTDYFCKLREKHFVREERSGFKASRKTGGERCSASPTALSR